jgi:DNA-binding transcriptional regulator YbjK
MRKGIANDPHRKERIAQAALDVVAEDGLRAATHRTIAARAEVPLGSVTYHFATLEDVLVAAFSLLGIQIRPRYDDAVRTARDQDEAREILLDAICGSGRPTDREMRLAREVYAYGSVSERVADLVRADYAAAIDALMTHFPEPAARTIDALVEGWWIHQSWNGPALDPAAVRAAIDAIADRFTTPLAAPADRKATTGDTND